MPQTITEACEAAKEHGGGVPSGCEEWAHAQAHSRCPVQHVQLNGVDIKRNLKIYGRFHQSERTAFQTERLAQTKAPKGGKCRDCGGTSKTPAQPEGCLCGWKSQERSVGRSLAQTLEGPQGHLKNMDCPIGNGEQLIGFYAGEEQGQM